jgi:ABC-type transport system involved in multi-copper enzyme maturation permease subunit
MRASVQFLAIARLTALEAIRRPVFLLVSLACLAGIVLMPLLINYTLGDSARIIRDSALTLYFVGGILLAATAAGETLARELRRGTAAAVLAKPVPRAVFFLAKAAGIWAALLLFSIAALAATLLAVRAGASDLQLDWTAALPAMAAVLLAPACAGAWNHRTRRPFASAAFFLLLAFLLLAIVLAAFFQTPFDHLVFPYSFSWSLLTVGCLLYFSLCMAAALATALATRLPVTPVLLLCAGLFLFGLMGDYLLGPHLDASLAARAAYALLPNVQVFWLLDALDAAQSIPPPYLALAAAYAAAWSAACLALGAASFQRLEIS